MIVFIRCVRCDAAATPGRGGRVLSAHAASPPAPSRARAPRGRARRGAHRPHVSHRLPRRHPARPRLRGRALHAGGAVSARRLLPLRAPPGREAKPGRGPGRRRVPDRGPIQGTGAALSQGRQLQRRGALLPGGRDGLLVLEGKRERQAFIEPLRRHGGRWPGHDLTGRAPPRPRGAPSSPEAPPRVARAARRSDRADVARGTLQSSPLIPSPYGCRFALRAPGVRVRMVRRPPTTRIRCTCSRRANLG